MSLLPEPLSTSPFKPERKASGFFSDAKQAEKAAQEAANKAYLESFNRGDDHDKSVFVREQSTGVRVDERGKRQEGLDSEKVKITENLKTQYKVFLKNLFNSLTELRKDPKTGLLNPDFNTTALAGTSRMHEKHLYFLLTDQAGKLDEAKVEEYLKDPDHVMLVEEILEDHIRLRMFGMGLAALADPRGSRNGVYEGNGTIRMDVDQGVINKAFEDYVLPWLNANNMVGNRPDNNPHWWKKRFVKMIGGMTAAGMVAGPVGLVAGAAWGAVAGAMGIGAELALANLFKRGVHVDKEWCAAGVTSIKDNQSEIEYLKAVVGIDVNDFTFDAQTGELIHSGSRTINREKILGETMGMMYTRIQYHKEIGVDVKDVDAMLEQGILQTGPKDSVLTLEQTRTRSKARIVELYTANGGSFDPYPTNPAARAQEVIKRLRILADARVQYMNEIILRDVQKEKLAKEVAHEAQASSDIADKIKSRTEGDGALVVGEREKIERHVADLTGQKEIIQNEGALLERLGDVRKDVVQKEKEIIDFLNGLGINGTTIQSAGLPSASQADIETSAQEVLRQMLEEDKANFFKLKIGKVTFGPDTVLRRAKNLKVARARALQKQDESILTSELSLRSLESNKKTAEDLFQAELERYKGMETLIINYQNVLSNIRGNKNVNAAKVQATIDDMNAQIKIVESARATLRDELFTDDSSTKPPTISLSTKRYEAESAYLAAKKTHEELVLRVNTEKNNIEARYSAQEEELEAHKELIKGFASNLKEKISARDAAEMSARDLEAQDTNIQAATKLVADYSKQLVLLTGFVDSNSNKILTENDLGTKSLADIMKIINTAYTVGGNANPDAWPESQNDLPQRREQVLHAMIEARSKKLASQSPITNEHRRQAIVEMTADLDKKILVLEGDKKRVQEKFKAEVAQLKEAQALLKRQTEILGNNNFAMEFILSTAPGADFGIPMSRSIDPEVSDQEKDVTPVTIDGVTYEFGNIERAYFVLLDMVTGYMSKGSKDARGKEFEKWSKVFPPNEMARLVCNHLLRVSVALNMSSTTPLLVQSVISGQIGPENVINFVTNAAREKVRKARALK